MSTNNLDSALETDFAFEPRLLFARALAGEELSIAQADALFAALVEDKFSDLQAAALLGALRGRGETPVEIEAAAKALLGAARPFPRPDYDFVDAAGTGGDGSGSINISTTASLVVAAAGGKVIKHGNSAVSSLSGSADVIRALGIEIPETPERARQLVDERGFCFLLAPLYHPVMGRFQPIRKDLGVPTLFNLMGPLLNPARPDRQVMGVGRAGQLELVARAMARLGRSHALVLHGSGLDEISVSAPTRIFEIRGHELQEYLLTPADLGLPEVEAKLLVGGDAARNAQAARQILGAEPHTGEETAQVEAGRTAVIANAAALLYVHGLVASLREGADLARTTIAEGRAATYLGELSA